MTLTITPQQRAALTIEVLSDIPYLRSFTKTLELRRFSRHELTRTVRHAVDDYADHLEALAKIAPPEIAEAFGTIFDAESLADSGYLDDAVREVATWLSEHAAI